MDDPQPKGIKAFRNRRVLEISWNDGASIDPLYDVAWRVSLRGLRR